MLFKNVITKLINQSSEIGLFNLAFVQEGKIFEKKNEKKKNTFSKVTCTETDPNSYFEVLISFILICSLCGMLKCYYFYCLYKVRNS